MTFGEQLRCARQAEGKTQAEMAATYGVSQPTYCQYETGAKVPNAVLAVKMAKHMGTTCEKLFGSSVIESGSGT